MAKLAVAIYTHIYVSFIEAKTYGTILDKHSQTLNIFLISAHNVDLSFFAYNIISLVLKV